MSNLTQPTERKALEIKIREMHRLCVVRIAYRASLISLSKAKKSNQSQFAIQFQLTNGEFLRYSRDAEERCVSPWCGCVAVPSACPWTSVVAAAAGGGGGGDGAEHVLALSARHRLYRDGEEIAGDVTSFCVHSEFLLVTTLKHTMRQVQLIKA